MTITIVVPQSAAGGTQTSIKAESIVLVQEDVLITLGTETIRVNSRELISAIRAAGCIYSNFTWTGTGNE